MLQTRALYNLLRLSGETEDFRLLSTEELFARLKQDRKSFLEFAEQCETPEELTDLLFPDDATEEDPFYLTVFELWRRLLPEKQSLSIFCDELDHRIALYDQDLPESEDLIQDALSNLLEVLDENADTGSEPEDVFVAICDYCANDLETFLFDYVMDLLDGGHSLYASELIEGFSPYVTDPFWFDFLRVRLLTFTDVGDANLAMHRLLEADLDLPLLLEILRFLSRANDEETFKLCKEKAFSLAKDEETRQSIKSICLSYPM